MCVSGLLLPNSLSLGKAGKQGHFHRLFPSFLYVIFSSKYNPLYVLSPFPLGIRLTVDQTDYIRTMRIFRFCDFFHNELLCFPCNFRYIAKSWLFSAWTTFPLKRNIAKQEMSRSGSRHPINLFREKARTGRHYCHRTETGLSCKIGQEGTKNLRVRALKLFLLSRENENRMSGLKLNSMKKLFLLHGSFFPFQFQRRHSSRFMKWRFFTMFAVYLMRNLLPSRWAKVHHIPQMWEGIGCLRSVKVSPQQLLQVWAYWCCFRQEQSKANNVTMKISFVL